jgi:hypothetical protein
MVCKRLGLVMCVLLSGTVFSFSVIPQPRLTTVLEFDGQNVEWLVSSPNGRNVAMAVRTSDGVVVYNNEYNPLESAPLVSEHSDYPKQRPSVLARLDSPLTPS